MTSEHNMNVFYMFNLGSVSFDYIWRRSTYHSRSLRCFQEEQKEISDMKWVRMNSLDHYHHNRVTTI